MKDIVKILAGWKQWKHQWFIHCLQRICSYMHLKLLSMFGKLVYLYSSTDKTNVLRDVSLDCTDNIACFKITSPCSFIKVILSCCPSKNLGLWLAKHSGKVTSLGYHCSHSSLLLIYHLWLLRSSRELIKCSHINAKHTRIILYTSDHVSLLKLRKKPTVVYRINIGVTFNTWSNLPARFRIIRAHQKYWASLGHNPSGNQTTPKGPRAAEGHQRNAFPGIGGYHKEKEIAVLWHLQLSQSCSEAPDLTGGNSEWPRKNNYRMNC